VRVTRPGLRVRSRRGFFGPADPQQEPSSRSGDPLLMAAMTPFAASAIMVRLTSLFGYEREGGPYVRSLLFLDPAGLTFTADESGRHVADAEIAQFAVGDNGEIVGDWRRRLTLNLTDDQLREARTTGVLYSTRMSVKEPGGYQVRTAVRDVPSGAVGSASQFLEVPRVGPGRLALSGLLLRSMADGPLPDEDRLDVMDAGSAVRVDVLGRRRCASSGQAARSPSRTRSTTGRTPRIHWWRARRCCATARSSSAARSSPSPARRTRDRACARSRLAGRSPSANRCRRASTPWR